MKEISNKQLRNVEKVDSVKSNSTVSVLEYFEN